MDKIEKTINHHGNEFKYTLSSKESGFPIVLFHGNLGNGNDFSKLCDELSGHDFRFITFDRVGHGKNSTSQNLIDNTFTATDTYAKIIELEVMDICYVVGYSIGCYYALKTALKCKNKIAGFVFLSPYMFKPDEEKIPVLVHLLNTPIIGKLSEGLLSLTTSKEKVIDNNELILEPINPLNNLGFIGQCVVVLTRKEGNIDPTFQMEGLQGIFSDIKKYSMDEIGQALMVSHPLETALVLRDMLTNLRLNDRMDDKNYFQFEEYSNRETGFFHGINARNNIVSAIKEHAEHKPDDIIQEWPDVPDIATFSEETVEGITYHKITYHKFYDLAKRTAQGLWELGIRRNDRVILFVPISLYLYQSLVALKMLDAKVIFLDSWARKGYLGTNAHIMKPKAMVSYEQAFILCNNMPELDNIPIKIVVGQHTHEYTANLEQLQNSEPLDESVVLDYDEPSLITITTSF